MSCLPDEFRQLEGTWEGEQKMYDAETGAFLSSYTTKVEMGISSDNRYSNRITNIFPGGNQMVLEFAIRMNKGVFEYGNELLKGKSTVIDDKTLIISGETKGTDSSFHEILRYMSEDERIATAQEFKDGKVKMIRTSVQKRTSKDGNYFSIWYDEWAGKPECVIQ